MLAIRVNEFGGPHVLRVEEVDIPRPGQDEILVRVVAAGVGPWDVSLRQGGYPGPLPYVAGGEFAGVVEGDTGSFANFYEGAPVYGYPRLTGCYAQYVTCPVEQLAPIPAALSVVDAAAAPIDALTAEQGLTDELGVGAGDRLLITAARHPLTVLKLTPSRAATAVLLPPSAQASTIRARNASPCAVLRRLTQFSKVLRSSCDSDSGASLLSPMPSADTTREPSDSPGQETGAQGDSRANQQTQDRLTRRRVRPGVRPPRGRSA